MLIRLFRARVRAGQEEAYLDYLRRRTEPYLRSQPGCLEVRVGRGTGTPDPGEFLVLTVWDTLEHLKAAAGAAWDAPVVDPEEAPLLQTADVAFFEQA